MSLEHHLYLNFTPHEYYMILSAHIHYAHISAEYVIPQFPIIYLIMLDDQIIMLKKWLLYLESTCSACHFINSHEKTRAQLFTFFTGRTKFLQQRQSLAVSAAGRSISRNNVIVSTACARSRGPTRSCRARLGGRATRARACRHCTIVRRDTCHVANTDNAHLTTSNSILCFVICALCAIMRLCS